MQNVFWARRDLDTPFFELTDEYFRGSSLDFRIISVVLMHWIDLLVLHSESKSSNWRFDPVKKEGLDQMVGSILLIIENAFKKVDKERRHQNKT